MSIPYNAKFQPVAGGTAVSITAVISISEDRDPSGYPCRPESGLGKLLWDIRYRVIPQMRSQPPAEWGQTDWHRLADDLEADLNELLPPNTMVDPIIFNAVMTRIINRWSPSDLGPHFPNIIAAMNGWSPLTVGETMSVGFGDGRYEIKRVE